MVHNEARVAPVTRSAAWRGSERLKPCVEHLTDSERASLAAHWTKLGQLEHASIAAFARFQLQLLALGAPPDLVEGCTRALADETAHTKLCFELASAYAGRAVGPGPLDIEGSLTPTSLGDVVDLVIAEGCFGETGAALEALEAADGASDPVIVAAYAQIAADEQRHAELAFRFVRWAIQQDAQVAARIRSALVAPRDLPSAVLQVVETCLYAVLAQRAAA
ncbi:MAG TPA: ferritin-like domain-containing protein [Steroidobacteraceae bacterium]|nr:ferritin-like domain-containing protein [Steroidobacteraceae bacterium]